MKKITQSIIFTAVVLLFVNAAHAKRMPVEEGAVTNYKSSNGRYTVKVTGGSTASCQLLDGEKGVSSKNFFDNPGWIAVSDNGELIAMVNWGWEDEGGSESISFYDSKWNLIKETSFGGEFSAGDKGAMKWVHAITVSPDGTYCAIGEDGKTKSRLNLYNSKTGKWMWEKECGLEKIDEIVISSDGKFLLAATHNYGPFDMRVLLLDITGKLLWQKDFTEGFSSDIPNYLRFKGDGKGFEIFDKTRGVFISESFPAYPMIESQEE